MDSTVLFYAAVVAQFLFAAFVLVSMRSPLASLRSKRKNLEIAEQRLHDLSALTSDWFWETDSQHRISGIHGNEGWQLKLPQEHFVGRTRMEIARREPNDDHIWQQHEADLMARKPFRDLEFAVHGADDDARHIRVSGIPRFDEKGIFVGYHGTATDVTVEISARQAEHRARTEAELANRVKTEFLANMSHELRTPLNAVIGFSDAMHRGIFGPLGDARYWEYAEAIKKSGQDLMSIIDDILSLSVVESGTLTLDKSDVDVRTLIASVLTIVRPQAKASSVILADSVPRNLDPFFCDAHRVKQIVLNLVSNAIKFTAAGGQVSLSVAADDNGSLQITVTDTGVGMEPATIVSALTPFGGAAHAEQSGYSSSGLGLSIAKAMAEAHDGSLRIESTLGKGTRVIVMLPRTAQSAMASPSANTKASITPSQSKASA